MKDIDKYVERKTMEAMNIAIKEKVLVTIKMEDLIRQIIEDCKPKVGTGTIIKIQDVLINLRDGKTSAILASAKIQDLLKEAGVEMEG